MARFFVNRPIVAMVISIVTILLGVVAMSGLPIAQYPEVVPPMVQVTTTFVGASATDVEASVATPLEQKVNGVEKMIYMKSTNANDGTLALKVSFDVGTNLDMANVLTQNRVSEAMPQMPQSVKNYGVAVKKALPFPLLIISIKSPNGTYDNNFLSNYTTININDLSGFGGLGDIFSSLFGDNVRRRRRTSPFGEGGVGPVAVDRLHHSDDDDPGIPGGVKGSQRHQQCGRGRGRVP